MRDNDLIRVFLPIISGGLTSAGMTEVKVKQANQPTQQGANTAPTVYFTKLFDKRYGFVRMKDTWDVDLGTMLHEEVQQYETTFQINALVRQSPTTPNQYTASDLVNEVASILQSESSIVALRESDVGILRITEVRNPYLPDDRDQFESSPSFDFVLTHEQRRTKINPVIDSYNYRIKRI